MIIVNVAPQDLFREAIGHPGPPEDFALQIVQEAIKPQVLQPKVFFYYG